MDRRQFIMSSGATLGYRISAEGAEEAFTQENGASSIIG